jgi:hypothetical protein
MPDLSPQAAEAAAAAAAPAHKAISGEKPVFNIAAEAKAVAHGHTTLTPEQNKEYEHVMDLFRKTEGRLSSPTWTAQNQRDFKAFTNELKHVESLPEADRTAIAGRLLYQGARSTPNKGDGLVADVLIYAPSSQKIQFTDQKGHNVGLEQILSEGIRVNTAEVQSASFDVEANKDRWGGIEAYKNEALKVKARDDAAERGAAKGKAVGHN